MYTYICIWDDVIMLQNLTKILALVKLSIKKNLREYKCMVPSKFILTVAYKFLSSLCEPTL